MATRDVSTVLYLHGSIVHQSEWLHRQPTVCIRRYLRYQRSLHFNSSRDGGHRCGSCWETRTAPSWYWVRSVLLGPIPIGKAESVWTSPLGLSVVRMICSLEPLIDRAR